MEGLNSPPFYTMQKPELYFKKLGKNEHYQISVVKKGSSLALTVESQWSSVTPEKMLTVSFLHYKNGRISNVKTRSMTADRFINLNNQLNQGEIEFSKYLPKNTSPWTN